ncbi:MFS transporter [Paenibacillus sp. GCM10027628]|uniref:MFS transporter n=1 Tax=Paenibacillus sp. GCM10027628 TaxID=3273413 RepID=UPI00362F2BBD
MSNRLVVLLLAIGAFVAGTGELIIAGIIDLIASDLHVSVALAGQLVTVFSLSFAIGTPFVIALTARMNRKKLLLITLACSLVGCMVAMLADSYAAMVLSRAILGVCSGVFNVVAFALAANLVAPDKRGSAIGSIQVGSSASLVVGVPLGIVIAEHIGWHAIFGVLAAATVIILLVILQKLPGIPGQAAPLGNTMNGMKRPRVIAALLINLLNVVGYSVCYTFITPFLQSMAHFTHASIGLMLLLMGICATVGSRIGGYATDKYGVSRTLFTLLAVHAVSLLLSPLLAQSAAGAVAMIIIWGISAWATVPTTMFYLISLVPESAEMAISVNTSVLHIGIALGGAAGGMVVSHWSVNHVGWIGGLTVIFGLLAAICTLVVGRSKANWAKGLQRS